MRQLTGSNSALDVATASRLGDNRFIGLFAESVMRNIAENNAIKAALLQASKPNSKRGAPPPSNFLKNTTKTTGVKQQASPGKSTLTKIQLYLRCLNLRLRQAVFLVITFISGLNQPLIVTRPTPCQGTYMCPMPCRP